MRTNKRLLSLLLSALLVLTLAAPALAADSRPSGGDMARLDLPEDTVLRAAVLFEEGADDEALSQKIAALPGAKVIWRYERLFSGVALEAPLSVLRAVEREDAVALVEQARTYAAPKSGEIDTPLQPSNSLELMDVEPLHEAGYDGDGIVIAVLDSELRVTHEAFADYGLMDEEAVTKEEVEEFIKGSTPGQYISEKIPFVYDYVGEDTDVSGENFHGTHVSALAAGYAEDEDGSVRFTGVAPAAQLLFMKVFSDEEDGYVDDLAVLKAMEDAAALGADVINLSLGSDNGFTTLDGMDGAYTEAFAALREEGVIICCAAGNSSANLDMAGYLPTSDYTDFGSIGSPATYLGATSIAGVESLTHEIAGYVEAGGSIMPYTDGQVNDDSEAVLLETLAGAPVPYVVVDGLGTAEDFTAVDVAGKVALVIRGEITFLEKAQNAAAAGAVACLVYNNVEEEFTPALDTATPIPCAIVSLADGEKLVELAGEGRIGTLTVSAENALMDRYDSPTPYYASAWGPTTDLRPGLHLAAPGGEILSASNEGDNLYVQAGGTSMAAPNAAGAFALMIESVRDVFGFEDKAEIAEFVSDYLMGTAGIMADENGVPYSPRRQGAGLIDMETSDRGLFVKEPILSLGESEEGRFTLSIPLQNMGEGEITLPVETVVLTDAYTGEEGFYYNALSSVDITEYVEIEGPETVTVPVGETTEVELTLTVSDELKEELAEVYPYGFYVEGYVSFGEGSHATFLGFCGDWAAAPIIEPVDFRHTLEAEKMLSEETDPESGESLLALGYTALDMLPVNIGANEPYITSLYRDADYYNRLGENLYAYITHSDLRNAIPGWQTDAMYNLGESFWLDLYTLRNAAHMILVVSDADTGEVYYVDDTAALPKAMLDAESQIMMNTGYFTWDGTDADLEPLPSGTQVNVEFYCWLEGNEVMESALEKNDSTMEDPGSYKWLLNDKYDAYQELTFPVTVDGTAPTAEAALEEETLTVTFWDNEFLSYAAVMDAAYEYLAEDTFAETERGAGQEFTIDLSGGLPEKLYLVAADYATNHMAWELDLTALAAGEEEVFTPCYTALLSDVTQDAWYRDAVEFVYSGGLMDCPEPLTFLPDEDASRIQMLTALYLLEEREMSTLTLEDLTFIDIDPLTDAVEVILWAYETGLTKGYDETTFGTHDGLSRQQLAVFFHRYAQMGGEVPAADPAALSAFSDGGDVADWAAEAMAWAVETGLLGGDDQGRLDPEGYATRAQLAQILMRFVG